MTDAEMRNVMGWLANLARAVAHKETPGKDTLALYGMLLAQDFPPRSFTTESLAAVLRGLKWWPPYDDLRQRLSEWWRDSNPILALPAPEPDYEIDRNRLAAEWDDPDGIARRVAHCRQLGPPWDRAMLSFLRTMVKMHAPQHLGLLT